MSSVIAKNIQIGADITATNNFTIYQPATPNGTLLIGNGNTGITSSLVTLNSSGNLGLGVTPSAWGSGYQALQIGSTTSVYQHAGNDGRFISNGYYATGNAPKYITTAASSMYRVADGLHYWYTAPSGTAGNAITFTQAMTLDASGNLLLGTTTVGTSGTGLTMYNASQSEIRLQNSTTGTGTTNGIQIAAAGSDFYLWNFEAGSQIFGTSGAERARIDSSGNLLVGITSGVYHELWKSSPSDWTTRIRNTSATSPFGLILQYSNAAPNNTSSDFVYCTDNAQLRATIRSNGGIANFSGNNVNLSDRREKTNFSPAKSYLDVICAIPVQTFNYIDQNMEEDPGLTLGVVAQDVEAVAPEMVMESNWGTKEEPKMRLSIYQTDLQYALMKCIQEQQAFIATLQADVAALKAAA